MMWESFEATCVAALLGMLCLTFAGAFLEEAPAGAADPELPPARTAVPAGRMLAPVYVAGETVQRVRELKRRHASRAISDQEYLAGLESVLGV